MKKSWLCFCFLFSMSLLSKPKEWTFLIFMNGHNSLDKHGATHINQMETIGSTADLNIVVQWASASAKTTKRLYITKDSDTGLVSSEVLEALPRVDMGNPRSLKDFLKWGAKKFPAKRYFVDVWNHGTGWDLTDDISYDNISGNVISTRDLGRALSEFASLIGHKVDIYGSDACLMGMMEVAVELERSVSTFIGSQDLEPGTGWPYAEFLKRWIENIRATPAEVSKLLIATYVESYSTSASPKEKREVSLSSLDLNKISSLKQAMSRFAFKFRRTNEEVRNKVKEIIFDARFFDRESYIDVGDFIKKILLENSLSAYHSEAKAIQKQIEAVVIENRGTETFKDATGVSVWLPFRLEYEELSKKYKTLKFAKTSWWSQFIDWYSKDSK